MRNAILVIGLILGSLSAHAQVPPTEPGFGAQPYRPPGVAIPQIGQPSIPSRFPQQPFNNQQPNQAQPQTPPNVGDITTVIADGGKNLFATLETSMGKIKVELYGTLVPKTVRNFVELANGQRDFTDIKTGRTQRRPFYEGLIFHKVIKGFAIQTGCPYGTGKGGPGYTVPDEINPSLRHDKPGVVSMANAGKNTNGSQFFITLSPQPELDDKFTIFGQVVDGMDVVRKISRVKVGPTDRPLKKIYLKRVVIKD